MTKTRKQTLANVANVVALAILALGASAIAQAQSTSCLVVGERTARVSTPQGARSPVFLATACDRLKLVSGSAQASWIARDGKLRIVPITPQGLADSPQAGAEERSVNVVWGELTTRREKAQPAYMRSFSVERPSRVYIPADGLVVVDKSDGQSVVTLSALTETGTTPAADIVVPAGQPLTLSRNQAAAGGGLAVQVRRGDLVEEWRWTIVSADESARIDARMAEIDAAIVDPEQRQFTQAMLFEQLKLHTNMDLLLQRMRARRGAGGGRRSAGCGVIGIEIPGRIDNVTMPKRVKLREAWYIPPEIKVCPLCGREIPPAQRDDHHLVPKVKGGRLTQHMHRICHRQIHALFTESELANTYNTVEALLGHPQIQRFVTWVRNKPIGFIERTRTSHLKR